MTTQTQVMHDGVRYLNMHKSFGLLDRCKHGKYVSVFKKKKGCKFCSFEKTPLHEYMVKKRDEKMNKTICNVIYSDISDA